MPMFKTYNLSYIPLARVVLNKVFILRKTCFKRVNVFNHIRFLRRCLAQNLIPVGFRTPHKVKTHKSNRAKFRYERLLVSEHLKLLHKKLSLLSKSIDSLTGWLIWRIHPAHWIQIRNTLMFSEEHHFVRVRTRQLRKFDVLSSKCLQPLSKSPPPNNKVLIHNISSYPLSPDESALLSRNLKAIPMTNKIDMLEIATDTEIALSMNKKYDDSIPTAIQQVLKNKRTNLENFSPLERSLLKNLSSNKNIVVIRADKGNATVIMDKTDYDFKLNSLVEGADYKELRFDPTSKIDTRLRNIVKKIPPKIKKCNNLFKRIITHHSRCPAIFGLPKIHKTEVPLRPIISSFRTVLSNAARFVTPILNQLYANTKGQHREVTNTPLLKQRLQSVVLQPSSILFSLDVVNMFGSIPQDSVFQIVKACIQDDPLFKSYSEISPSIFLEILRLILENSYFIYNEKFYSQLQGLPMGSPTSPILASFYMHLLETKIEKLQGFQLVSFLARYVDDYCGVWTGSSSSLTAFLPLINSLDEDVKFTLEIETDGTLNFLDAKLVRIESRVVFRCYAKDVSAEILLPRDAFQDDSIKRSVLIGETIRSLRISDARELDLNKLRDKFRRNKYSHREIEYCINKGISIEDTKFQVPMAQGLASNSTVKPLSIPIRYIGKNTTALKKRFRRSGVRIIHKRQRNLEDFFTSNYKYNTNTGRGCVYQIDCSCGSAYIGETAFTLKKRLDEHQGSVKRLTESNALAYHVKQTGHMINWSSGKVLLFQPIETRRLTQEALCIQKLKPALNFRQGQVLRGSWSWKLRSPKS